MTPALVVCFRWKSNRDFYITYTKFYEKKNVWFNKVYVRKKHFTQTWLATDETAAHMCRSAARRRAARSHRPPSPSGSLLTPCHSGWCRSLCRGLLNEQHFHLTCLWVCFMRWLLLIGAFWLYSAHLGSLWAGWHVSQITRGSSHLKPSTLSWLQKLHPGTRFFTRLFLLIYFLSCWKQWLLALDKL